MYENYDGIIFQKYGNTYISPSHGNYGNLGLDIHAFIFPSCTNNDLIYYFSL